MVAERREPLIRLNIGYVVPLEEYVKLEELKKGLPCLVKLGSFTILEKATLVSDDVSSPYGKWRGVAFYNDGEDLHKGTVHVKEHQISIIIPPAMYTKMKDVRLRFNLIKNKRQLFKNDELLVEDNGAKEPYPAPARIVHQPVVKKPLAAIVE